MSRTSPNPLALALYEPEIPANTGNVARLCAATGTPLHLIGRLGFSLQHPEARRAGMDYWTQVELHRHLTYDDFLQQLPPDSVWFFSTRAERLLWDAEFGAGDVLLFGSESRGLPVRLVEAAGERAVRIPMRPAARSLNLATAAGIGLYEALRRTGWPTP